MTENPPSLPDAGSTAVADAALASWLQRQTRNLRRRYLWYGLALCLLLPGVAIAAAFALDHTLRLPLAIRWFHTATIAALLGYTALRFVAYPLRRRAAPTEVALLVEQRFPALRQQLVSAVQFAATPAASATLRNQSAAMIARLRTDAAAAAAALPAEQLFDGRRSRWLWFGAATTLGALATGAILAPTTAWTFLQRHCGADLDYPRNTALRLEVPAASADVQREDLGDLIRLVLPAGADLPVAVTAEGVVPNEVFLEVEPLGSSAAGEAAAARSLAMGARGPGRFRHVFRRTTGSFAFHARGGDDDRGDRRVEVRTVHPPQVASIQAEVTPPAYTGAPIHHTPSGAIEGLAGSEVRLEVATTLPVRSAQLVFLESGLRLPLAPVEVPDDSGGATVLRGSFRLLQSDRYQVELLAQNGLRNPNPGTYPVTALPDYAPVGRWLLPEDDTTQLLATGMLCVRVEARDDFGLRGLWLTIERGSGAAQELSLLPPPAPTSPPARLPTSLLRTELLELGSLLAGERRAQDSLSLLVQVTDNCVPGIGDAPATDGVPAARPTAGNRTDLPRRIVQIVEPAQLNEAIAKLFRGLREDAQQGLDLVLDRRGLLGDLLAGDAAAGKPRSEAEIAQLLTGIEVGQGRIGAAAERLHRGLMRAFDLHLWNRLEPSQNAAAVLALYRTHASQLTEPVAYAKDFYRELLAARAAGTIGALEQVLDPILGMLAIADRLATTDAPRAARLLAEAQVARSAAARDATLQAAAAALQQQEQGLQELLLRLGDWHDYQDLIQEARALRDRQLDLQNRTEAVQGKQ